MAKFKKLFVGCFVALPIVSFFISFMINKTEYAKAETDVNVEENILHGNSDNVSTYGLFTSLSISIDGGNGNVWTTVRNDITIFPSTVVVIVELYSSTTYYESFQNMNLVSTNSTTDLNIYQSITASAPTGGVQKYWKGRMRYKIDSKAWKEEVTGTLSFDGQGNFLGYL